MTALATETSPEQVSWDAFLPAVGDEHAVALAARSGNGWHEISYAGLRRRVESVSSDLVRREIRAGDRVAILAESSPEWVIAFFAILRSGGVAVPLDPKLTESELAYQVGSAEPRVLFVSTDRAAVGEGLAARSSIQHVIGFDDFDALPAAALAEPAASPARPWDDVALITYTSGTTGHPKGVMTTFGNLLFQVQTCADLFQVGARDVSLSVLPLNHLLELTGSLLVVLYRGGQACFAGSLYPQDIADAVRERGVTRMVVVPMFLSLLEREIERQVRRRGRVAALTFKAALAVADWIPSMAARRAVFASPHRELGGSLTDFVCGGAPLDPAVGRFFDRLGVAVYQGYGMTEASPVITTNRPGANRLGSVGRPIPGTDLRVDDSAPTTGEGEILTHGPHVMRGYFGRDDLTYEALDEAGWLHTGDLGRLDSDGYLYITGRIKDLIVLGGGKKVLPEEVEAGLASPLFAEVCVLGRRAAEGVAAGSEEVWAVVVPSTSLAAQGASLEAGWCRDLGPGAKASPSALQAAAEREVELRGRDLAPFKRPARVIVHRDELPRTSTRKVRRSLVHDWLDEQIAVRS
jgi:long-chain acyl-CoA synthetase